MDIRSIRILLTGFASAPGRLLRDGSPDGLPTRDGFKIAAGTGRRLQNSNGCSDFVYATPATEPAGPFVSGLPWWIFNHLALPGKHFITYRKQ